MPISKRHSLTNSAGLRQSTPYARPVNETTDTTESGFFPLQPTRYPMGTPLTAIRSKKIYSDLADERAYLTHLREFWSNKLQDLKEDHRYLCKMRDITKNEVIGIQPLFTRKEDEPLELEHPPLHNTTQEVITNENAVPITTAEETLDPSDLLGGNIDLEDLDELEKLEAMFKSKYSDDEDDEKGDKGALDDDDEDEAKQREALSLLLQEFGDGL